MVTVGGHRSSFPVRVKVCIYVRRPQSESIHWCKTTQVKDVEAKLPVSSSKYKCLEAACRTQLLRLFEATVEIPPRQLATLCILSDHFRLIFSFYNRICQFGGNMFWNFFSKPSWPVADPQDFQLGVWLLAEDFLLDSEEGRRLCAQVGGKSESILVASFWTQRLSLHPFVSTDGS